MDIVLKCRDTNHSLKRISETLRLYDVLQYPLLFVKGEDGYHLGISQVGENTIKTVSCMDFYAYHFMTRENSSQSKFVSSISCLKNLNRKDYATSEHNKENSELTPTYICVIP